MVTTVYEIVKWINANPATARRIAKAAFNGIEGITVAHNMVGYSGGYEGHFMFEDPLDQKFSVYLSDPGNYLRSGEGGHNERAAAGYTEVLTFKPGQNACQAADRIFNKLAGFRALAPEDALKAVFKYITDTYRAPVSRGCVAAYLADTDFFWVSKRRSSANIAKIDGKFRLMTGNSSYVKVFTSADESTFEYRKAGGPFSRRPANARQIAGNWYDQNILVPIYHNFNSALRTGGEIASYVLPAENLPTLYRTYEGANGPVYTNEPAPYSQYDRKSMHNYSTRIETLLQPEDLFRTGKVDLYRNRDKGEVPYLGWELEACDNASLECHDDTASAMRDSLHKLVMCKPDGSISPRGFETVSIPATLDFWKEVDLTKALDKMRRAPFNMRSYEHASCGFHVHVSRAALSVLDLQKIERFMHNPANRDFLQKVAGRPSTSYATYTDSYFTDRKSMVAVSRGTGGRGINLPRGATSREYILSYFGPEPTQNTPGYLARCLWEWTNIAYEIDPRTGDVVSSAVQRVRNGSGTPAQEEMMLDAVVGAINRAPNDRLGTFLKLALSMAYPTRTFTFNDATPAVAGAHPMAHLVGVRKTKLPLGRKNSYEAARQVEGPLGKGRQRYDVLNTSNEHTIEFRLFKGTMNGDSVYRYLEFVDALVRFVPTISATDSSLIYHEFIKWIISDSFNRARYGSLVAFFVANEFVKRGDIRKRDLKVVVEVDNIIEAVVVEPEPQVDEDDDYEYEEEYDEEPEYDGGEEEDGERCSCGCGMLISAI